MKADAALLVSFAVVLTLFDRVWVQLGALVYPTAAGGQPLWVPPLFGVLAVVLVRASAFVTRRWASDEGRPRGSIADVVRAAAWFLAAHAVAGAIESGLRQEARAFALVLAGAWWVRLGPERDARSRGVVAGVALAVAFAGTLGEIGLSRVGLMAYPGGDLYGVPLWLPALWLHAGLLARAIARTWFGGR